MKKATKLTLVVVAILFALYAYWDIKTWKPCGDGVLEDDQDIEGACISYMLKKAQEGDKRGIYLYTRHMEMTVLDEFHINSHSNSIKSLADGIVNQQAPSKAEYLHWLRIAAKTGYPEYIRTALDFCQAGVPSFDTEFIQEIFESPQRKTWHSDTDPKWKETNKSELAWIDDLEKSWHKGEFLPCRAP